MPREYTWLLMDYIVPPCSKIYKISIHQNTLDTFKKIWNTLYGRIERPINCFIVWHSECRGIILKLFNIIWTNQPTCSEEFNLKRDSLWLYTFEEYIPRYKMFIPPSQIQDPRILSNIQVCLIVANTSLIIYIISNGH